MAENSLDIDVNRYHNTNFTVKLKTERLGGWALHPLQGALQIRFPVSFGHIFSYANFSSARYMVYTVVLKVPPPVKGEEAECQIDVGEIAKVKISESLPSVKRNGYPLIPP